PRHEQPPSRPAPNGLSPVWFWFGVGGTALLGGALVASAIDVKAKHDEYADAPTADLQSDGKAAQVRTNVLVSATAGAAVITAIVGFFFVGWSNRSPRSAASRAAF